MIEEAKKQGLYFNRNTRSITPGIQNLATQIHQAQRQFSYTIDQENYRLEREGKK